MDIQEYLIKFYIDQNGETITENLAKGLVCEFPVTDGSQRKNGEKWIYDECISVGDKIGIDWNRIDKNEWYLVMNMMYSDYYPVGKKYGLTDYNFFCDLAEAWFYDVDGKENKTFKYFFE